MFAFHSCLSFALSFTLSAQWLFRGSNRYCFCRSQAGLSKCSSLCLFAIFSTNYLLGTIRSISSEWRTVNIAYFSNTSGMPFIAVTDEQKWKATCSRRSRCGKRRRMLHVSRAVPPQWIALVQYIKDHPAVFRECNPNPALYEYCQQHYEIAWDSETKQFSEYKATECTRFCSVQPSPSRGHS